MKTKKPILYFIGGALLLSVFVVSVDYNVGSSAKQSAISLQELRRHLKNLIQPLFTSVNVSSGGHPNHGASCDTHVFKDFSPPKLTLSNKRPPTQFLGADYDIRNDPWPPDPSVDTGFYRVEPDGGKVIHSAPTPSGFEERWILQHDKARKFDKASAWMLGYYDCEGIFKTQGSQVWSGEIFDAEVEVVGTSGVSQTVSGTFADMYDSGGTRIIVVRPFGGSTNIYGFAIYGSSGQYDHFTGVLKTPEKIPALSFFFPSSGAVGATVNIYGYGFTPTNNKLKFGLGIIGYLPSADGRTITFTVPSQVEIETSCPSSVCPPPPVQPIEPGNYEVSVSNFNGTSDPFTFTVKVSTPTIKSIR